jgi:hypothetical protein
VPNALQITDPDSDNPLAQVPSWADAAQSVSGTVSSGVDALGQWLAAMRAKNAQWRGSMQLAGDVVPLPLNDPSNFAQPERMPDTRVQPWDKYDWARQLFILPSNDPGRRQRPNTLG